MHEIKSVQDVPISSVTVMVTVCVFTERAE